MQKGSSNLFKIKKEEKVIGNDTKAEHRVNESRDKPNDFF